MISSTDLFAGAGGSSTGMIQVPGIAVRIAANHVQLVTDIHAANHPNTDHAVVDLHLEDPRFFPKTDMLWASPECTQWSIAGSSQVRPPIEEGLFWNPDEDDVKQRSRLLMFDVLKFIEHHRYRLVIVENVVDIAMLAKYATAWAVWRHELAKLGYAFRVVSLNSMHAQMLGAPAPQSRDRLYVMAWPEGEKAPDVDRALRPRAYCPRCDVIAEAVQSFKPGRTVGRYRAQYLYLCRTCNKPVEPGWLSAETIVDWSDPGERIGDRWKYKTKLRAAMGIARYWGPIQVEVAGNTYDAADPRHVRHGELEAYYRAWPVSDPLGTLTTTATRALAIPMEGRDGKDAVPVSQPLRTQTTRQETGLLQAPPFIAELRGGGSDARAITEPLSTVTAGGNHHALVMRNNEGGAEMTTPAYEYLRTLTTTGHQSLIQDQTRGRRRPSVKDVEEALELVSECYGRMLKPSEIAAGMAFPDDYVWHPDGVKVSNRALVKAAGNAVTPPSARDLAAVGVESMGVDLERAA